MSTHPLHDITRSDEIDEVERMLRAGGSELQSLLGRAAQIRDQGLVAAGRPNTITYSRKVFIPLTTLCRDRCHYCTFVDTPAQLHRNGRDLYMSPQQVLAVARRGAALGCKEALFTLGDRPEDRWPEARAWLHEHGYASTLEYVGAMARLVRDETGLLPHLNPGVMTYDEMRELRPTAPSMGMMLETTARHLYEQPGRVHFGSPDKDPVVRLRALDDAGRARIPFTTGLLIGIGESLRDRAISLLALRDVHNKYGHLQEVILQNFRAKPQTAMHSTPDADRDEYVAAIAVARIVLGPHMRIQVPPNLSDPAQFALLLDAGADDWGGVSPLTADHVNPERPWPQIEELAARTAECGFELRERLTTHPEFLRTANTWIDDGLHAAIAAIADPATLLAREATAVHPARTHRVRATHIPTRTHPVALFDRAAAEPATVDDVEWSWLLCSGGDDLERLVAVADEVRRYTVGEAISLVANRNVSSSLWRSTPSADTYTRDDLADIVIDAQSLGATEICTQGPIHRSEPHDAYLQIARTIKAAAPHMHLHAFRPADICDFADRSGRTIDQAARELRNAGVDTIPGTGVKILAERVRALSGPDDLPIEQWVDVICSAHHAGLRSSSVVHYGHVETADERIAHLRRIIEIQQITGGFTELVPMPHPDRVPLVDGRSAEDEHRAMFAVARLMLSESIRHIQVPWTRLGDRLAASVLRSGGDDLGGTLFDGSVCPEVGAEYGNEMTPRRARRLTGGLFRPLRQRTTDYRDVADDGHRIL